MSSMEPNQRQGAKYLVFAIATFALLLYRQGQIRPSYTFLAAASCLLATAIAWAVESRRRVHLEWFYAFMLYCLSALAALGIVLGAVNLYLKLR